MAKDDAGKKMRSSWPQKVVNMNAGKYSDGHPLDQVQYLECKIILKGNRFTSVKNFHDFSKLVGKAAARCEVDYDTTPYEGKTPQLREVLFMDTKDFKLYNNNFILRRRTIFQDGFFVGDPEVVFKFRHPDIQTAAEMDVRPNVQGAPKIKFKCETLPLQHELGGYRMLYSHNVEFPLSMIDKDDRSAMSTLVEIFPALQSLKTRPSDHVELVNDMAVTEVLLDVGSLYFGKGLEPKANVSVWRNRGDQKQLVGEFAFQCKFDRGSDLHDKAVARVKQFFVVLQEVASDWIELGVTKTAAVYKLKGSPNNAHE